MEVKSPMFHLAPRWSFPSFWRPKFDALGLDPSPARDLGSLYFNFGWGNLIRKWGNKWENNYPIWKS